MPRPTGNMGRRSSGHRSAGMGGRSSGHRSAGSSRRNAGSSGGMGFGFGQRRPGSPPPHHGYGAPPPPPPRPRRWHTYRRRYYHPEPGYYAPRRRSHPFLVFIIVCFFGAAISLVIMRPGRTQNPGQYSDRIIQTDTGKRAKIKEGLCQLTDYYKDGLGYLSEKCEKGLKYFYRKTNVQPVVMTMDISKVSDYDDHEELNQLYSEMFEDEAHFLFIIFGNKEGTLDWEYSYIAGSKAVSVMDDDAVDLLFQYIDDYYYDSDASDDELVSNSFRDTADSIMK